ncbi:MAG: hypothetical protein E6J26_05865, partial [Chloroflexi bacterium]
MRINMLPRARHAWMRVRALNGRRELARRIYPTGLWDEYSHEAAILSGWLDFTAEHVAASNAIQQASAATLDIGSMTWFIPDFYNADYGGIHTLLRFANHFSEQHGVCHQFVVVGTMQEDRIRSLIVEAFPNIVISRCLRLGSFDALQAVAPTDIAVASLWSTAYFLLRFNATKR